MNKFALFLVPLSFAILGLLIVHIIQMDGQGKISTLVSPIRDINMLDSINNLRMAQHELPLTEDSRLDASAKDKACDMRDHIYFSHQDLSGAMSWHLLLQHGYSYYQAGENLSEGFDTNRETMDALMNSPEHRDNILNSDFTNIGIATCGKYLVQHFANEQ